MDFIDRIRSRAEGRRRGAYRSYEHVRPGVCFAQDDQSVANAPGATVRSDINSNLQALVTNSSGAAAPGTTWAYQWWADTTSGLLKQRNAANTGWLVRGTLAETFLLSRSSNTILGVGDVGRTIVATSTFTQTLTAAATLGDGWWVNYRNDSTGLITLDPNASETIDGNTNTTLAAGESCVIQCNGSAFKTIGRAIPVAMHGQCYLAKSGANLVLSPFAGNKLVIADVPETIPDAGCSLAPTSLAASTTYYIYAVMSGGVMIIEASTTAPATQTGTGVRIKNGDSARTLVGMARTNGSTAWEDDASLLGVISYFNRRDKSIVNNFTANRSTTSGTYVELNSEIRGNFLTWGDEAVEVNVNGVSSIGTTNVGIYSSIGFDGTNQENAMTVVTPQSTGTSVSSPIAFRKSGLSEGFHYATLLGASGNGVATATWSGASFGSDTTLRNITSLNVTVRG